MPNKYANLTGIYRRIFDILSLEMYTQVKATLQVWHFFSPEKGHIRQVPVSIKKTKIFPADTVLSLVFYMEKRDTKRRQNNV